jgi:hypothetical protein
MVQIIAVLIFGALGIMFLYVGATQFLLQRKLLATAEPIDALITRSEVVSHTSRTRTNGRVRTTTTHRPEVRFSYAYLGRDHESDMLYPTIIARSYASREAAHDELLLFPVGERVQALVSEHYPDKAFLVPQRSVGPVIFLILGIILPPAAWIIGGLIPA